jgi:hypothetical protein
MTSIPCEMPFQAGVASAQADPAWRPSPLLAVIFQRLLSHPSLLMNAQPPLEQLSQTTMVGDAREPGRKACLATESRQPLPRHQERLLGALAGIIVVLQHAQGQIEDVALMPLDEERTGILVPSLAGLYKLRVVLLDLQGDDTWVKPIWLHLFHCMH